FRMELQTHAFHEVFLVLRGRVVVQTHGIRNGEDYRRVNGLMHPLDPGDYLVVPAGTAHIIEDVRASTLVLVAFSDAALDACPGRRAIWTSLAPNGDATRPVIRSAPMHLRDAPWRELIALSRPAVPGLRSVHSGGDERRLEIETAFSRFLIELHRLQQRPRVPDARERVRAFSAALPELVHEGWSLDRAAAAVHLSRRRFSELWRLVVGESFVASLQRLRIATAQKLMRDHDHSIVGAAFAAGFDDLANFYRIFRKHVGTAPGQWMREEHRE
ncbi:MAG: AraC family transcriptional regulator, partial [Spirochaetales bacterium]|nr:AraC family transcriptional regulator [Spirochaetales bacterium]